MNWHTNTHGTLGSVKNADNVIIGISIMFSCRLQLGCFFFSLFLYFFVLDTEGKGVDGILGLPWWDLEFANLHLRSGIEAPSGLVVQDLPAATGLKLYSALLSLIPLSLLHLFHLYRSSLLLPNQVGVYFAAIWRKLLPGSPLLLLDLGFKLPSNFTQSFSL